MENLNFTFDFILIGMSIWMIMVVKNAGLGGVMGNTLTLITVGALILGIAHFLETFLFEFVGLEDVALGEFIHRIVIFAGFLFLILGLKGLSKLRQ